MVSSNYKVSPLGKHKIETSPEYCELFHKGNQESGNAGNREWGISGKTGKRRQFWEIGNWET